MNKINTCRLCISLCMLLMTFSFWIQAQEKEEKSFEWAEQIGGKGEVSPASIVSDAKNNIYIGGSYTRNIEQSKVSAENKGKRDVFIAKYTQEGKQSWFWNTGGTGVDNISCMMIDVEYNLWFAGIASEGIKFGKTTVKETGKFLYLAKIDEKGKTSLIQKMEYTGLANINVLLEDFNGNVLVGGNFNDTLSVGSQQVVSNGNKDIFLLSVDDGGSVIELNNIGGEGNEILSGIAYDNKGGMYIGGLYSTAFEFKSIKLFAKEKGVFKNSFVAKLNTAGEPDWVKSFHAAEYIKLVNLKSDQSGNLYICGDYTNEILIADQTIKGVGQVDVFVAKFNSKGEILWSKQFGSLKPDYVNNMHLDKLNGLVLSGSFHDSIRFGSMDLISETSGLKAYVTQLNKDGYVLWCDKISGEGNKLGKASVLDNDGNIFLTGSFCNSIDKNKTKMESLGEEDVFLAKFHYCLRSEEAIQADKTMICPGEELVLGIRQEANNIVWNDTLPDLKQIAILDTGFYNVQFINAYGCQVRDTIRIDRAAPPEFTLGADTIIFTDEQLTLEAPAEYSQRVWHDNTTDPVFIVSASSDMPQVNKYSLQVWDSLGCQGTDTIEVEFIQNTNWFEFTGFESIVCYPNPVRDDLNWYLESVGEGRLMIDVVRENGNIVYQEDIPNYKNGETHSIDMSGFKPGVYILSIKNDSKTITISIVHN